MVGACWDEDGTAVALLERLAGGLAASRLAAILSVVLHACQRSLAFCDAFFACLGQFESSGMDNDCLFVHEQYSKAYRLSRERIRGRLLC